MKFLSLQPFVPSGNDFESSKEFFQQLGFSISWDAGDYVSFVHNDSFGEKDGCKFILQKFNNKEFAENFMITVGVTNVDEFRKDVIGKKLPEKFGVRIGEASDQPYGREVNIIDIAGVCWNFVQQG
jgi:predicted lactoylglutathione lyase